ncbi:5-methyltetrahydropteroyltriglutamate--homocysteine methyltransferase [Secundilactobacillus pentosiphilus]|uniref:5-methyltetrahydropteroyltriglutamate--homocysteine methyltransferase n=1 Tax=Secundilactobacillus pentosiphilus TaxID=1714682 RepID=A0A1Z5IUG3_9LACO|nr:5-methyltetrahydropteroyltriglutamate--homocysteine S-methyltransferase [Secundilactobacillus pentosiphilus]GAX04423.1 5-methyltetrahydropteroyltriglutamate--homocysteine methyltransferase [Secundilactobacillus pentosiphilus]GAX05326.1 5-methyltetrahydropteroyltriglutamate--homocysteinemethyltransferase [Secundilactobacillus pentosiphilus]
MTTTIIGYPRIGSHRELKFAVQKYFKNKISARELAQTAAELRKQNWDTISGAGIDQLVSNDFSYYDTTLDTANLLNIVPKRYKELNLSPLDEYFAQARGYQGDKGDVTALSMKKWFNTNYHYLVPEFEDDTAIKLVGSKIFDEYQEAKDQGYQTRPVILGPYSLLRLSAFEGQKQATDYTAALVNAYEAIFEKLADLGADWIQLDEPQLVKDQSEADLELFTDLYKPLLSNKHGLKILLQTYFGDVRDSYDLLTSLDFDGLGLDFHEGDETLNLIQSKGFPADKLLFAGIINGKNIWKANYDQKLDILHKLPKDNVVLSTSCSLLHVPYTLENEPDLDEKYKKYLSFAKEKLTELTDLDHVLAGSGDAALKANEALFAKPRYEENQAIIDKVASLKDSDFHRQPSFEERAAIQKKEFNLPELPTTTIGSFPQTREVRRNRAKYKRGEITKEQYDQFNRDKIKECVEFQEKIGLDVLVHGEYERNDMVEYFGEKLDGFLFTSNAWVQSYGTRCVKPPVIWGDVNRNAPITVAESVYAQSLTDKPMKGMLTGPVTILNWSFPREDISKKESTLQIALAIQAEALDLEKNGIKIIQIDEPALREKLPLRKSDWYTRYLDWAIPAFRLVGSKVQPTTQIHTHMCYSEFGDIIDAIDAMDADVISFEASRADLTLLDTLQKSHFKTHVGPGVYDIHSPRIPSENEVAGTIHKILKKVPLQNVWINPDCGLKTRGTTETTASLENVVAATKQVRKELTHEGR